MAAVAVAIAVIVSLTTVLTLNHRADVAAQERRDEADRVEAAEDRAAQEARLAAEEEAAAELADARAQYSACTGRLAELLDSLEQVDARLHVGMSQADLSDLVGDVSNAYTRMEIDELGTGTCLLVAVQLENAFNSYSRSVSDWNDCIYDYGCDTDAITPDLQVKWLRAPRAIERGDGLLDSLDPDSPDYDAETGTNNA